MQLYIYAYGVQLNYMLNYNNTINIGVIWIPHTTVGYERKKYHVLNLLRNTGLKNGITFTKGREYASLKSMYTTI